MNKEAKPSARPQLVPPIELTELGGGLVCDPTTGICAVPEPTSAPAEQRPAAAPNAAPAPAAKPRA